ncbi:ABC transporter permease [Desulfofustis glycolicus]|uniref:Nucleoside ABC transporter membrane protein n=1 Tax=Desulfofustis glycolicus DSM 9705 TaxID=1121409 RepID=A0A1M5WSA5_9BACT|nr:ABC transporter permease [Desulfofustis glycolicus]MCB2218301.1 ABC transporter permease [Desulfobulbaceae bacterium]SHH90400.1 nucleoside ABC transporter membrane protein [Desulfofustis glycolicus DSM 9705]
MNYEILIPLLAAAVQSGTPILYATLGEIFTERTGILNLGVEGIMIVGALSGFLVAKITGNPAVAFFAAGLAGAVAASLHGIVCIIFQGNQVVSGLALTILGVGFANYIGAAYVGQAAPGFDPLPIPLLSQIPGLGPIFFRQDLLVYLTYLIPPLMWLFLYQTRYGLSLRAAGENPAAAIAAGVNVVACRFVGVLVGGFFIGLGGAYLSLAYTHLWTNNLTGGRGWIAVALVIFAFWRPSRAIFGAYLFGGVMALQLRLQASGTQIPSSLLLMLPYALTIGVLVLASWRRGGTDEPAALGRNIEPVD